MTTATTTQHHKSFAVTAVGVATLLLALGYLFLGGVFIYSGTNAARELQENDAQGWGVFLSMIAGLIIVVGIGFAIPGVLGVIAGIGDVMRKLWGRVFTYIFAVMAFLWGAAFAVFSQGDPGLIILAAVQVLYGVAAFAVLIMKPHEYSRPMREDVEFEMSSPRRGARQ